MFTEFDKLMAIERLIALYQERGEVWNANQIRRHARAVARLEHITLGEAYDEIEDELLDNPPDPEVWE